jgi:SH3-like domain-containing protein
VDLRWPELHRAVVTASNPTARIAPTENAAPSFDLKPGVIVRAERTYGQFVHVRSSEGRTGWVTATEIEKIVPSKS